MNCGHSWRAWGWSLRGCGGGTATLGPGGGQTCGCPWARFQPMGPYRPVSTQTQTSTYAHKYCMCRKGSHNILQYTDFPLQQMQKLRTTSRLKVSNQTKQYQDIAHTYIYVYIERE